nr:hypothetical protein Itr_chr06CG09780 [Ipomoea trifida]
MPCQSPNLAAFARASATVPLHRQRPCHLQPNHHAPRLVQPPSGPPGSTTTSLTRFNRYRLHPIQPPRAPRGSTATCSTRLHPIQPPQAPPGSTANHMLHLVQLPQAPSWALTFLPPRMPPTPGASLTQQD